MVPSPVGTASVATRPTGGVGVDLSGEARARRCQECYDHFDAIRPRLRELAAGDGATQRRAVDLLQGIGLVMGMA